MTHGERTRRTPKGVVQMARPISGDEAEMMREYFFSRVTKGDGCWLWGGGISRRGYGLAKLNNIRHSAHRLSVVLHGGTVPVDKIVCHTCDNPRCVNPSHLYVGTTKQNAYDRTVRGRGRTAIGPDSPSAKLTVAQVLESRFSTARHTELAAKFGVSPSTIRKLRSGKSWRHV